MLNKFENPEEDLPQEDPRFLVMSTWANVNDIYNKRYNRISTLLGEFDQSGLDKRHNDPSFNYAVELEAKLQSEEPEFNEALYRLRTALDGVTGWHISWRHHEPGEVLGLDDFQDYQVKDAEKRIASAHIIREPNQYHENEGWIVGSKVGVDYIMGGVSVWLEISDKPYVPRGINENLGDMYAIELIPPNQVT